MTGSCSIAPPGPDRNQRPGDARRRPDRRARHPLAAVRSAPIRGRAASRQQGRVLPVHSHGRSPAQRSTPRRWPRHPDWPVDPDGEHRRTMARHSARRSEPSPADRSAVRRSPSCGRRSSVASRGENGGARPCRASMTPLDPQLVLGAYAVGRLSDGRCARRGQRLLGRAQISRDPAARRFSSLAFAAQDDRLRSLPRDRRHRIRDVDRAVRRIGRRSPRHLDQPADRGRLHRTPPAGLRAFDRMWDERPAGRRPLRPGAGRARFSAKAWSAARATRRRSRSPGWWRVSDVGGFTCSTASS